MTAPASPRLLLAGALGLICASCATTPPGPPPDVVRLEDQLERLHADPRIAGNAGPELANADAAVDTLARNARTLDAADYQQGVYLSDKLIQIAEASAFARYAEQRGAALGAERERLLASTAARSVAPAVAAASVPPPVGSASANLLALQSQLGGLESRVDERGLVVRVGNYMFEPDQAALTPTAQRSLDSLARALRAEPGTTVLIEGRGAAGDGQSAAARAAAVRDYLNARGVELARLDLAARPSPETTAPGQARVEVLIRTD
ncbi:MAG TPA: OmpA family protein [Dokdonella sp.]